MLKATLSSQLAGAPADMRLLLLLSNPLPAGSNASLRIRLSDVLSVSSSSLVVEAALLTAAEADLLLRANETAAGLSANESPLPYMLDGASLELDIASALSPTATIPTNARLLVALRNGLRLPPYAIAALPGFELATLFTAGARIRGCALAQRSALGSLLCTRPMAAKLPCPCLGCALRMRALGFASFQPLPSLHRLSRPPLLPLAPPAQAWAQLWT